MIRGRSNIRAYYEHQNVPVWKLYSKDDKLIASHSEGTDPKIGLESFERLLDLTEPGIYKLTTAPAFTAAESRNYRTVNIALEAEQPTAGTQQQQFNPYMNGIGMIPVNTQDYIAQQVEIMRLKDKVEQLSGIEKAGPLDEALGTMMSQVIPAAIAFFTANKPQQQRPQQRFRRLPPAASKPTKEVRSVESEHDEDSSPGNVNEQGQRLSAALEQIRDFEPDGFIEIMEKLAAATQSNPDTLRSILPMLDTL